MKFAKLSLTIFSDLSNCRVVKLFFSVLLTTDICDCLSKNPHSLHQNWIQFYCYSLQAHSISIHPQCIKCWMLTGLLFSRAFCQPSKVMAETMGPMGAPIGQWGPVFSPTGLWPTGVILATVWALWLLMGCPKGWFFPPPTPPHPPTLPLPIPPHPTPPHRPSHLPPLLSILTAERDGKNTLKFGHQR